MNKAGNACIILIFILVLTLPSVLAEICHDEAYEVCLSVNDESECQSPLIFNITAPEDSCDEGCLCVIDNQNLLSSSIVTRLRYNYERLYGDATTYIFDDEITLDAACLSECEDLIDQGTMCVPGQEASNDCYCGSNYVLQGEYCCLTPNGLVDSDQECTQFCQNGEITQECYCEDKEETSGFCCDNVHQTLQCTNYCSAGEIQEAGCQCGNNIATSSDVGEYCCNNNIQSDACDFSQCPQDTDLQIMVENCYCGDDLYETLDGEKYCCNDNLQNNECQEELSCQPDGVLADTEQCDPLMDTHSKCPSGSTGCTNTCECIAPVGCDRPSSQWECHSGNPVCADSNEWCLEDLCVCVDNAQCNDETCFPAPCDGSNPPQNAPQIVEIKHYKGEKVLELVWTYDNTCQQDVDDFWIYQDGNIVKVVDHETLTTNITITPTEERPNICYKIKSNYGNTQSEFSEEKCEQLGDLECYNNPDDHCFAPQGEKMTQLITCTNKNVKETNDCPSDYMCIQLGETARCVYGNDCTLCNDAYQSFGAYGTTLTQEGMEVNCEDTEVTCYKEYVWKKGVPSSTPMYLSCVDARKCGDYKSELSCEQENERHCRVGECSWVELNQETGTGYCKDNNFDSSQCNLCDELEEENPFFQCDRQMCERFGQCYFSEKKGDGSCVAKEDMICEWYNKEDDCDNGYAIDVQYNTEEERISGTNEITPGNDFFNFNKCRWANDITHYTPYSCFKDSDGDYKPGPIFDIQDYPAFKTDPENRDFTNPITIIAASDDSNNPTKTGKEVSIPIGAHDEQSEIKATYICYTQVGGACYPDSQDNIDTEKSVFSGTFNDGGVYQIKYYSEDTAKNLEEIKSGFVEVINDSPNIEVLYEYTPEEVGNDEYLSRLVVWVEITSISGAPQKATCTGQFVGENIPGPAKIDKAYNNEFELYYDYVKDGHYLFEITCVDSFGNSAFLEEWINIDGDKSITNIEPWPPQTYDNIDGLKINFETATSSDCRLSTKTQTYSSMEEQASSSNGREHTYTLDDLDTDVYKYYIACETQAGEIIEGKPGDYAEFAVDKLPPLSVVLDHAGNAFNYDAQISEEFKLKLGCNDNRAILIRDGVNWNAGCKIDGTSIWYKFSKMNLFEQYYNQPFTKQLSDGPLEIYSIDLVGNKEQTQTIILSVKDETDPTISGFSYYDMENE